jgi:5-methylthioribose kinase
VAADWFSDPARAHREALGLVWLSQLAPEGCIPALIFEDPRHHLLAMQAVPKPHENWKSRLLAGRIEKQAVAQFGELLGTIHRRGREQAGLAATFDDRTFFETLRVEPYYRFTAARHPGAEKFFAGLIQETLECRLTVVHGDYSPKNILVREERLVLLDHEVIHFGDPAFDLGFSLAHLLSKANHLPSHRSAFLEAALRYWEAYRESEGAGGCPPELEARAVRHTLGCLLARVDGRSPLEYLTEAGRTGQRRAVLSILNAPPPELTVLFDGFARQLSHESASHVHD